MGYSKLTGRLGFGALHFVVDEGDNHEETASVSGGSIGGMKAEGRWVLSILLKGP